jgi:hypothetical protein
VDRLHLDANPDLDPNFDVYANPVPGRGPDSDWHQNNDLPPVLHKTHVGKSEFFSFNNSIDTLQFFSSVSNVSYFSVLF